MSRTAPRDSNDPDWSESYDQLRALADRLLRHERADHTLQPTALVHEVWLRFRRDRRFTDADHAEIVAQAARAMRDVLVEHARRKRALSRGGAVRKIPFEETLVAFEERAIDLIALHQALEELQSIDPQLAHLVEVRFFGGLTEAETARVLAISPRSVRRSWQVARNWLWQRLGGRA